MLIAFMALVLIGVAASLLARAFVMDRFRVSETLEQIDGYGYEPRLPDPAADETSSAGWLFPAVDRLAERAAGLLGKRTGGQDSDLRLQLVAAGLYRLSPSKFIGYRILAAIAVPAFWLWFATFILGASGAMTLVGLMVTVVLGWQLPGIIVRRKAERRLEQIDRDLPELIDLLVVTIEAGIGFTGSLQLATNHFVGPLGDEIRLTLQEQRMGLSTTDSLQNLLARANTPGMGSFVRSIIQGQQLGVSIGHVLRDLTIEMRKRRRQKAQERAQRAPIKMLFPLVFLIFPALFVILLAPAVFSFMDAFS